MSVYATPKLKTEINNFCHKIALTIIKYECLNSFSLKGCPGNGNSTDGTIPFIDTEVESVRIVSQSCKEGPGNGTSTDTVTPVYLFCDPVTNKNLTNCSKAAARFW